MFNCGFAPPPTAATVILVVGGVDCPLVAPGLVREVALLRAGEVVEAIVGVTTPPTRCFSVVCEVAAILVAALVARPLPLKADRKKFNSLSFGPISGMAAGATGGELVCALPTAAAGESVSLPVAPDETGGALLGPPAKGIAAGGGFTRDALILRYRLLGTFTQTLLTELVTYLSFQLCLRLCSKIWDRGKGYNKGTNPILLCAILSAESNFASVPSFYSALCLRDCSPSGRRKEGR
jgi:hypothetical protein